MKRAIIYPEGYNVPLFLPMSSKILDAEWNAEYQSRSGFGDTRRLASYDWLSGLSIEQRSCVINAMTSTDGERKRAQRFINNDQVSVSEVIERCCMQAEQADFQSRSILNIIDETKLTFADAVGRIPGHAETLGTIGNGFHYGQNCVAGMLVDQQDYKTLGLGSLQFYSTDFHATPSKQRKGRDERPLHYRGNEKWGVAARQAMVRCSNARRVIHVADRESDNLNFLSTLSMLKSQCGPGRVEGVIRAKEDRLVHASTHEQYTQRVRGVLAHQTPLVCCRVDISADERMVFSADYHRGAQGRNIDRVTKRVGRSARLELRCVKCRLDAKTLVKSSYLPAGLARQLIQERRIAEQDFYYLHVREVDHKGKAVNLVDNKGRARHVDWLLITTLPVDNALQALEVLDIYRHRFPIIEELFRGMKKDGFDVEKAQQQSLKALQIVSAMAAKGSAMVMKMIAARDLDQGYPLGETFTEEEIEVLEACLIKYQGNTPLQSNPFPKDQLSWAAWIIARIGGWKPGNRKRPPGPKTLHRGLEIFYSICLGAKLWKQAQKDVSQP